jgi:hypothetical protein
VPTGTAPTVASWRNLFRSSEPPKFDDSDMPSEDIRTRYESLLARELRHIGVPGECVHVEVGQKALDNGRELCNIKLRIVRWERSAALRLLVGLPLLETRVRQAVAATELAESTQFAGIWLHSSGSLPAPEIERDSEWAISELQLPTGDATVAADRLRQVMGSAAR